MNSNPCNYYSNSS